MRSTSMQDLNIKATLGAVLLASQMTGRAGKRHAMPGPRQTGVALNPPIFLVGGEELWVWLKEGPLSGCP